MYIYLYLLLVSIVTPCFPQNFNNLERVFVEANLIKSLDFKMISNQSSRFLINFAKDNPPLITFKKSAKSLDINIKNTKIPSRLLKQYNVADFRSPAKTISLAHMDTDAKITIFTNENFAYSASATKGQEIINIFPKKFEKKDKTAKLYKGQEISLNFQSISIQKVLKILAEFTGINMIVSKEVRGTISLKLDKIPWDEALDIILKTNSLDKRRRGSIYEIAPRVNIIKQEREEFKTKADILNIVPLNSEILTLSYAKAEELAILLKDKERTILSNRGTVTVDVRTNSIWIQDTRPKISLVKKFIKHLDKPAKQVEIEARIVDVSKDFAKELGIRFGISKPNHLSGTLEGASQIAENLSAGKIPLRERLNMDFAARAFAGTPASIGIALAKLGDGILLDLELSALESEGRGEIIARPRLITTNQQTALIQAGEEIPYQETSPSGATSVVFKKAVLSLKVTPQITPDNKIMMDLQINQDRPSAQVFNGVPAVSTKEIQTKVLVNNGQTIVLGGIYKQSKMSAIKRVPFLGQMPVFGVLFRAKHKTLVNEELLIFITTKIIV